MDFFSARDTQAPAFCLPPNASVSFPLRDSPVITPELACKGTLSYPVPNRTSHRDAQHALA